MKLPYLVRRVVQRMKRDGFVQTIWIALSLALEPYYEWRLGIRAFGPGKFEEFSIPTDHRSFRRIMRHVDIRPHVDSFIDYGCGRGRVLAMASTYPFRKIIGIEYLEVLGAVARENIKRINPRLRKCSDIELVTGDAGELELPLDVTVAYFFDPFGEDVFRRVVEQIHRSILKSPRKLTIIYYGPAWEHILIACDWLIKVHELEFPRRRCCIYETRQT